MKSIDPPPVLRTDQYIVAHMSPPKPIVVEACLYCLHNVIVSRTSTEISFYRVPYFILQTVWDCVPATAKKTGSCRECRIRTATRAFPGNSPE